MKTLAHLLLANVFCTSVAQPSPGPPKPGPDMGCSGIPPKLKPGVIKARQFRMTDPDKRLGTYNRRYQILLPADYTGKMPLPMHLYFHGWGENVNKGLWSYKRWEEAANKYKFIMVLPEGQQDGTNVFGSWNVGAGGRNDTCNALDTNDTTLQYTSCTTIGAFSPCNCFTCYDDVQFVSDLYAYLTKELCIDKKRIYGSGVSNGAMFLYPLVAELAQRGLEPKFKAIAPWYGAFLKNMQNVPSGVKGISILHSHGTRDVEIPVKGGESQDGWLYTPVDTTLQAYASLKGCGTLQNISSPYDGYNWSTPLLDYLDQCYEYSLCNEGRIVRCDYHEEHSFWPSYANDIMWWFFSSLGSKGLPVVI